MLPSANGAELASLGLQRFGHFARLRGMLLFRLPFSDSA